MAPGNSEGPMDGASQALAPLESHQRSQLGLPPTDPAIDAASLPPLTAEQWADPAAVSARLVVLQTNYRAGEDPAQVRARWTPFLVERLVENLAASGGTAASAEFRAVDAVLVGDVVGVAVVERASGRASVALTVRRSVLSGGNAIRRTRIDFWLVEAVLDPGAGRWLVAAVERS